MLGRIYTIKCSEDPRVYVGSTFKTLDERLRQHVNCSNGEAHKHLPLYQAMNEYGSDKFTIELLEEVDDVDKSMLFRIEGMHIEMHQESLIPLFNKYIAGRNKREYDKQYREANKEHIREHKKKTTICECGSTVRRNDLPRHKRTRKHVNWESSQ